MDKFLEFVAEIFECEVSQLSAETAYNEFPAWDSMMQLRLVMEIEDEYDIEIPIDQAGKLKNLGDFYHFIEEK